jgi:hypothetical protein
MKIPDLLRRIVRKVLPPGNRTPLNESHEDLYGPSPRENLGPVQGGQGDR